MRYRACRSDRIASAVGGLSRRGRPNKLLTFLTTALSIGVLAIVPASALAQYSYQRILTLGGSGVIPSTQNNFTVLVCANGTGACSTPVAGLGNHVTNASGYDIVFSSTQCSSPTLLSWELERYMPSTGELLAWVLFPSLSAGEQFYMCYGSSAASFQGGSAGAAWNSNYVGVWHMNDNAANTTVRESTGYGSTGAYTVSTSAGSVPGPFGSNTGMGFPSDSTTMAIASTSQFAFGSTASWTYEMWVNPSNFATGRDGAQFFDLSNNNAENGGWFVRFGNQGVAAGDLQICSDSAVGNPTCTHGVALAQANAWQQVVTTATYQQGSPVLGVAVYNNASSVALGDGLFQPAATTNSAVMARDGGNGPLESSISEMRILNVPLSQAWITTEYNNQSSPSTFLNFGAETSGGGSGGTPGFTMAASPTTVNVGQGGSAMFTEYFTSGGEFNSAVSLSYSYNNGALPSGLTIPPTTTGSVPANGSLPVPVTVTASSGALVQTYLITVTATSGTLTPVVSTVTVVVSASTTTSTQGPWTGANPGPIYYNGGNVGIGTAAPGYPLQVNGPAAGSLVDGFFSAPSYGSYLELGVQGATAELEGAANGDFQLNHYGGASGAFRSIRAGAVSNTLVLSAGNVGIGITNPQSKLAVNGSISAAEIVVSSSPADYVFEPGYRLAPLSEVGDYIKANRHLPEIPSAAEVREKGVGLGEMQSKLLAKIEELTLHLIEAEERIQQLEAAWSNLPPAK